MRISHTKSHHGNDSCKGFLPRPSISSSWVTWISMAGWWLLVVTSHEVMLVHAQPPPPPHVPGVGRPSSSHQQYAMSHGQCIQATEELVRSHAKLSKTTLDIWQQASQMAAVREPTTSWNQNNSNNNNRRHGKCIDEATKRSCWLDYQTLYPPSSPQQELLVSQCPRAGGRLFIQKDYKILCHLSPPPTPPQPTTTTQDHIPNSNTNNITEYTLILQYVPLCLAARCAADEQERWVAHQFRDYEQGTLAPTLMTTFPPTAFPQHWTCRGSRQHHRHPSSSSQEYPVAEEVATISAAAAVVWTTEYILVSGMTMTGVFLWDMGLGL